MITDNLKFILDLAKIQAVLTRRFDAGLGGLGLTEMMILFQLSQAEGQKMRRIDLAEKIGLTASGVTRLLVPMEKIGLVKRDLNEHDARVRYVMLASGGKRKLSEGMERAELLAEDIIKRAGLEKVETLTEEIAKLAGKI
jgi:DNA-binding MarR family transcriptional regulator